MPNPIKHTSQAIDNWSFDETYEQAAIEILVENVAGTALVRQKPIATEAKQDDIVTILTNDNGILSDISNDTGNLLLGQDPLAKYKVTDIDDDYFGFTDASGKWYIMYNNGVSWRYLKGDSGYTTAWTNRVGAGYDYFYNIF
jgi:hypothetical protein